MLDTQPVAFIAFPAFNACFKTESELASFTTFGKLRQSLFPRKDIVLAPKFALEAVQYCGRIPVVNVGHTVFTLEGF